MKIFSVTTIGLCINIYNTYNDMHLLTSTVFQLKHSGFQSEFALSPFPNILI